MEDIAVLVDKEHAGIAFPELKSLAIDSLGKLQFIPETILNKLEQLKVCSCDSLQGLFEVKSTTNMLPLRNLELVDVKSLKHIPWTLLPNLHSLVIHGGLPDMKSIISSTAIVQGNVMHQLEYVSIEQCEHLQDIVSKECDGELDLLKNGTFIFPRLKHIKLHNLPNIATFSSGSYSATFRALEKVEISSCPSLGSFTLGTLETPKLKSLHVDQIHILQKIDLNPFLRCQKQGLPQLQEGSKQGDWQLFHLNSLPRTQVSRCKSFSSKEEDKRAGEIEQLVPLGGPTVPEFGAWNKNPELFEGYTDAFNQVLKDKKTPGRNATNAIPVHTPSKLTKWAHIKLWKKRHGPQRPPPPSHKINGAFQICKCFMQWAQSGTGNIGCKAMYKLKRRLCDILSHKKNIGGLQTQIQLLMEELAEVQNLLVSEENDSKDEVQQWLAKAVEILKEANGITDGRNNMADKKCICSTYLDLTSSLKAGEMLRDIEKILEERKGLSLSSYFGGLSYCKNLKSREYMLQEILEALLDIHINIVGIYGMIGVGKTVLVKELARYAQRNQLFDDIVMVKVSDFPDVKLIQTKIANKIGLQLETVDDEETRAHFLYNALEEKIMEGVRANDTKPVRKSKILIILDGIQHAIDLQKVGIPYGQEGRASSKVVLISRNADICKNMGAEKQFLVDCLDLDEAKILFQERLSDKNESMEITQGRYQYMEDVLLIKCRGLPLVINSLACALKPMSWSTWEVIVDQVERHTLVEVDELKKVPHAILELCNNFIRGGEKQKLFLLCCLIQQGMDLTVTRLLRYGMGLGLFENDSLASIADQINSWVDELKSLSLLLERNGSHHLVMHDIVQDVVIFALCQGDDVLPVVLDAGTCWYTRESYETCVAISMPPDSNYKCVNGLELPKLQACLLKGKSFLHLPDNFFQGMQSLKILDISGITFEDFPSSIGDLKNLVTLHLEYCDIKRGFMSTISTLTKLEVLSLRESSVETIPEEIGNLTNLRVLDLSRCKNFSTFCVDAVANLDQLRGLYLYDICWDWSADDMEKLKSLPLEVLEIIMP